MKIKSRRLLPAAAVMVLLTSAGCGHNALSFFNGADLSIEPNLDNGASAHIRYGQSIHILMKEKSKAQLTLTQQNSASGEAQTGNQLEIIFETGDQINGYAVDLEKQKNSR